jgi:hypothetical protein
MSAITGQKQITEHPMEKARSGDLSGMEVYGLDHSPWVQAVLLGLYDKNNSYALTTAPTLTLFNRQGIMMPAARMKGEKWQYESADILGTLGYGEVSSQDMKQVGNAWQGVMHRADNPFRFFNNFSYSRDTNPSVIVRLKNHFLRSFAVLYFFLLITFGKRTRMQTDPSSFGDQFLFWEDRLEQSSGAYINGDEPGSLDFLLFGVIQCHCSIEVPPLSSLLIDTRLKRIRVWIATMHERFSDYEHLYSSQYFEPKGTGPKATTFVERMSFWLGTSVMLLFFPITVPAIIFLAVRVRRKQSS